MRARWPARARPRIGANKAASLNEVLAIASG
jgi:hypothetical protein